MFHLLKLLQTANMFLEMIDPYLVWMKLYSLVQNRFLFNDGLDTAVSKSDSSSLPYLFSLLSFLPPFLN